jgi:hypothetical protein
MRDALGAWKLYAKLVAYFIFNRAEKLKRSTDIDFPCFWIFQKFRLIPGEEQEVQGMISSLLTKLALVKESIHTHENGISGQLDISNA